MYSSMHWCTFWLGKSLENWTEKYPLNDANWAGGRASTCVLLHGCVPTHGIECSAGEICTVSFLAFAANRFMAELGIFVFAIDIAE